MKKWKAGAYIILALVIAASSFLLGARWHGDTEAETEAKSQAVTHPLLASRIFNENAPDTIINFEPLRRQLRAELASYGAANASLYFEYLPTGTSIRIGDNTQLIGASLLKLPFVMDLYYLEDMNKFNMDDKVELKAEWLNSQYGELYKKGAGYKLSIRDLVKITLEDSDNTALNGVQAIASSYKLPPAESSFNALDVDFTDSETTMLSLTARSYSSFLKCLYFACYVSPDHSQEILGYLTETSVGTERMVKYLPNETLVAHKIGTLGERTQSDCGIVYVKNRNYVLCVMLNDDQAGGGEVIAKLSDYVYKYVTASD